MFMETDAYAPAAAAIQPPVQQQHRPGEHVCSRSCRVTLLFGNCYKCESSGQMHVCDQNCTQLMDWDREHLICRVSQRLFPKKQSHLGLAHCSSMERKRCRSESGMAQP